VLLLVCKQKNLHKIKREILNFALLSTYPKVVKYLISLQIEYYFFIHRIIKETINKMIINIRNEINKSFFFINIKPPSYKKLASTQQLVFPIHNYTICTTIKQVNKLIYIKSFY